MKLVGTQSHPVICFLNSIFLIVILFDIKLSYARFEETKEPIAEPIGKREFLKSNVPF